MYIYIYIYPGSSFEDFFLDVSVCPSFLGRFHGKCSDPEKLVRTQKKVVEF